MASDEYKIQQTHEEERLEFAPPAEPPVTRLEALPSPAMTTGYSHWFLDFNLQNARNVPSVASSGSLELVTESFPILRAFSNALNGEVYETVLAGYGAFILVPLGTARRSMAIDTPLENLNCASFRRDKVAIYGIPANKDDGIFRVNASLYEIIAASSYDPAGMASILNGTMPMKIAGDHTVLSLIERDWFDMESTIAAKLALSTRLQPRPDTSYQIIARTREFEGKKDDEDDDMVPPPLIPFVPRFLIRISKSGSTTATQDMDLDEEEPVERRIIPLDDQDDMQEAYDFAQYTDSIASSRSSSKLPKDVRETLTIEEIPAAPTPPPSLVTIDSVKNEEVEDVQIDSDDEQVFNRLQTGLKVRPFRGDSPPHVLRRRHQELSRTLNQEKTIANEPSDNVSLEKAEGTVPAIANPVHAYLQQVINEISKPIKKNPTFTISNFPARSFAPSFPPEPPSESSLPLPNVTTIPPRTGTPYPYPRIDDDAPHAPPEYSPVPSRFASPGIQRPPTPLTRRIDAIDVPSPQKSTQFIDSPPFAREFSVATQSSVATVRTDDSFLSIQPYQSTLHSSQVPRNLGRIVSDSNGKYVVPVKTRPSQTITLAQQLRKSPPRSTSTWRNPFAPYVRPVLLRDESPNRSRNQTTLAVPGPDQARSIQRSQGRVPAKELAHLINLRALHLTHLGRELAAAIDEGLHEWYDNRQAHEESAGRTNFDIYFPHDKSYGSSLLTTVEQLRFRQCLAFWIDRNSAGEHVKRIARIQNILGYRSRRGDDEHIRRLRDSGRLGEDGDIPNLQAIQRWIRA